jgi:ABC-type proline/glycine betaine transport system substrate-binding protein
LASEDRIRRPIANACEYPNFPIDKLASTKLQEKTPEVVEMLKLMDVGLDEITAILNWSKERGITDPDQMAIRYLQTYDDRMNKWFEGSKNNKYFIELQKAIRQLRNY